jgi:hypothetical protein
MTPTEAVGRWFESSRPHEIGQRQIEWVRVRPEIPGRDHFSR